jgi:hypothetical protein
VPGRRRIVVAVDDPSLEEERNGQRDDHDAEN